MSIRKFVVFSHQRVKCRGLSAVGDVIPVALSTGIWVAVDTELVACGGQ